MVYFMENPIKTDDLGIPLFLETPLCSQWKENILAIVCDLFGMVKWPLQRLSDLQLGDQKVTLDHMDSG